MVKRIDSSSLRCAIFNLEDAYQNFFSKKNDYPVKESDNYLKIKKKLAGLYSKIKNTRKYYMNEIINKLTKENDIIVSEKLDIKEMSKNHHLSKSILDASFHQICLLLKWKMKHD